MRISYLLFSAFGLPLVDAYLVSPPGTAAPGANNDCSKWVEGSAGGTCANIEATYNLTEAQFEAWNPTTSELGIDCTLLSSFYYCVQINFGVVSSSSTSATTTSSATVTKTTITTPTPYQSGMSPLCDGFHLVVSGDQCDTIVSEYGITLAEFYAWNPAVGTTCESLDLGDYVCINIIGLVLSTTFVTTTSTPTTTGDGITTPTPYQTGMATDCDSFHLVVSGDECGTIATEYGISLDQFYAWNPAVGTSCAYLDLGDYFCVDIIGVTPSVTITSTSTTTSDSITTPTPYQTGMATDCDSFHLVVSGDQCGTIVTEYGISLDQFYAWNPAVGATCKYLDLGDYVCVDIIGVTPSATAITTTATTVGDGVTTPTPIQTGMVTNCDAFHLVVSGDECGTIASDYEITLDTFYLWNPAVGSTCAYLDLGDYVCVGIL